MTIRTILVDDEPLAIQGLQLRLEPHRRRRDRRHLLERPRGDPRDQDPQARPRLPRHPDAGLRRLFGDPGADGGRAAAVRLRHRLSATMRCARSRREAVDYLMKPVEEARLADTLERVRQRLAEKRGVEEVDRLKEVLAEVAPEATENAEAAPRTAPRRQPLREDDQHQGPRPDLPRRRRHDRADRRRRRLYVHLDRRQHADPARDDEGPREAPRPAPLPARPPLDHRQSRPGPAGQAAHQRRMLPGARTRAAR